MAKFLSYVGKAWSFALRHLEGEHFIVHDCQSVPKFLSQISKDLASTGSLTHRVVDVEGMYPSMPKPIIRVAMREVLSTIRRQLPPGSGSDPKINVPRKGKGACSWAHERGDKWGHAQVCFSTMIEALEFVLENTYVKMRDGRLLKQAHGIPMGDSLSPAIAIGTTAWMETEWMQSLDTATKARFRAGRFMDDVIMVVSSSPGWDADAFVRDFESSTCYMPPLKLEAADDTCFLETKFALLPNGTFRHRLKNVNEGRETNPIAWRYHRFDSFCSLSMKEGVMISCMRKIGQHASDEANFQYSLECKLKEFEALGYPWSWLRRARANAYLFRERQ
jgi:hypothetical protein